jgi:hypothetical protein
METIKVLQNMEERFDYALYSKARGNENRLSDIVWAMCKSDKEFFKTFFEEIEQINTLNISIK